MQVVLLAVTLLALRVAALSDLSDIPGSYCATRSVRCCTAREDSCSVPILGTMCYCDDFCDRAYNDDCCPDFPYVCRNVTRTTTTARPVTLYRGSCWYKNREYPEGTGIKINCNDCKCQRVCQDRTCSHEMVCSQNVCLVDPDLLTTVNQDRFAGFKVANYTEFWGRTLSEGLTRRLGTRISKKLPYKMRPINTPFDRDRVRTRLWYDLRSERPQMISPPLDQGWCAADWVISTVQVATDRLMLVSKGEDHTILAPQHLLSCNAKNQRGCNGGHITRAWKFIQKFGLVPDECYPWVGQQTTCKVSKLADKKRTMARCPAGNTMKPLHRTGPAYRISTEPEAIMYEILTSGPVQASMRVHQVFFSYRSGVYRCSGLSKNSVSDPYHSVRIVGWGEEYQQGRLVKYWIVSNSWGTWWGESGYFRIVRGDNECDIENLVLGAWINPIVPQIDPSMPKVDNSINILNSLQ